MGITKRLLDLARSNLNALIDPIRPASPGSRDGDDELPLDRYSDDELRAELDLRQQRRRRQAEARTAREQAERAARERVAREKAERMAREQTERAARERAARAAQASAGRASSSTRGTSSTATSTPDKARLAELYAQLETPNGSPLEVVKRNFRRLMRQHHPDLHGESPAQQKAATERTMKLTAAYDELERLLGRTSR